MFTQNWSGPQLARSVPHSSMSAGRRGRTGIPIPAALTGKLRPGLLGKGPAHARAAWQRLRAGHQHEGRGAAGLGAAQLQTFPNLPCS